MDEKLKQLIREIHKRKADYQSLSNESDQMGNIRQSVIFSIKAGCMQDLLIYIESSLFKDDNLPGKKR